MIHTAETKGPHMMPDAIVAKHWRDDADRPLPTPTLLGESLSAFVNDSRWLVQCECGSAQIASRTDRRFFCTTCGVGWVTVQWPDDETVATIEAALLARPRPYTRSWTPDETVEDLLAQNAEHEVTT